jgi:hypothetical protein
VQVADVVEEVGAEILDLRLSDVDLVGSDAELQEGVGEVTDEEDQAVANEAHPREGHDR